MKILQGRRAIETKWVCDVKQDGEGVDTSPKSGLVARGFSQVSGIDFREAHSPVSKYFTIFLLVASSLVFNRQRSLLDVGNEFVSAQLTEGLYVVKPEGFIQHRRKD